MYSAPIQSVSPAPIPALQIFNPEPTDTAVPTLRDIFDEIVLPDMNSRACTHDTISDVRRAIDRWEEFWAANPSWQPAVNRWSRAAQDANYRIGNPVVVTGVTAAHLEHWRTNLQGAERTKNKYVAAIQQILNACDRYDIPRAKVRLPQLQEGDAVKYYITSEQLCQMWPYADYLKWPNVTGISNGDFWRSVVAMFWTYGFRLQDFWAIKASKSCKSVDLPWEAIRRNTLTPNPNGEARHDLGWLTYTPSKTKRHRFQPLYLPITAVADAALRRLARVGVEGSIIKAPRSSKAFYATWYDWQHRAGVRDREGKPFIPYALRKSAATYLDAHRDGLADAVMGWSTRTGTKSKMASEVYVNTEPTLITYLPTYKYPSCFDSFLKYI